MKTRIKIKAIYLFKLALRKESLFPRYRVHKWIKYFPHQENEWEKFARMILSVPTNIKQDEAESHSLI